MKEFLHLCSKNRMSWIFGLFFWKCAQVKTAPLKSATAKDSMNNGKKILFHIATFAIIYEMASDWEERHLILNNFTSTIWQIFPAKILKIPSTRNSYHFSLKVILFTFTFLFLFLLQLELKNVYNYNWKGKLSRWKKIYIYMVVFSWNL